MIAVVAFKTSDGKIFETEDEAQKHEVDLILMPRNSFYKVHLHYDTNFTTTVLACNKEEAISRARLDALNYFSPELSKFLDATAINLNDED